MISFEEARRLVLAIDETTEEETVPMFLALGRALAASIPTAPSLSQGTTIGPAQISLLTNLSVENPLVYSPTSVGFFAVGDPHAADNLGLENAKLTEVTAATLVALCQRSGMVPVDLGVMPDDAELIAGALIRGFETSHIVCTIAAPTAEGLAVAKRVVENRGGTFHFDGVAQHPGSALCLAELEEGWWFGLPADPLAAMLCYELYVRPLSRKLAGHASFDLPRVAGSFDVDWPRSATVTTLALVRLFWEGGEYCLHVSGGNDADAPGQAVLVTGVTVIERGDDKVAAGSPVPVYLLE